MKQKQQIGIAISAILFILTIFLTNTFAQKQFAVQKLSKANSLGSKILSQFKMDPTFKNYFENTKNPSLSGLLKANKAQGNATVIDSMVSSAYDTSYQWIKISYQYDGYGYITDWLGEYIDDGVHGYFNDYQFVFRPDGQLKSDLSLDWVNGAWVNDQRESYTYDPNGNIISELDEQWDTTANNWVNDDKYEYSYDANHNRTLEVQAQWDGSSWKNSWKYEYSYDANNNMTLKITSNWPSTAWEKYSKYEWIYDANNNKISEIGYLWTGSAWENYTKTTNTYDANNNNISRNTFSWNSSTSQWDNRYWYLYTYDSNNKITFENKKKWDSGTSNWVDDYRITYTNSASGKMLTHLKEKWDGSNWNNDDYEEFTYDVNDNLLTYLSQLNWVSGSWTDGDRLNYVYNAAGNCEGGTHEVWFTNHWVSADSQLFLPDIWDADNTINYFFNPYMTYGYEFSVYYGTITNVNENNSIKPNSFSLSQNYPNPFNPSTKIKYQIPNSGYVSLKIYDVLGEEVASMINKEQPAGSYEINFDASKLTSGIYFYQLKAGNNIQIKKMMLLK